MRTLPLALFLAACSSSETATPDPSTGSSASSSSTAEASSAASSSAEASSSASSGTGGSTPAADYENGSRLKVLRVTTDDGGKGVAGWYDSELEVECAFALASDGIARCLPRGALRVNRVFGDARCTRPLLQIDAVNASCTPPAFALESYSASCPGAERFAVRRVTGTVDRLAFVHEIGGAGCTQVDVDGDLVRFAELSAEPVPASDFVAATIGPE